MFHAICAKLKLLINQSLTEDGSMWNTIFLSYPALYCKIGGNLIKRKKNKGKIMKITINFTKENVTALIGIVLIQGALLPSHFSGHLPHISLPSLVFLGLCCYMYKGIVDRDFVYITSNGIGMVLNGSMIIRILIGG